MTCPTTTWLLATFAASAAGVIIGGALVFWVRGDEK